MRYELFVSPAKNGEVAQVSPRLSYAFGRARGGHLRATTNSKMIENSRKLRNVDNRRSRLRTQLEIFPLVSEMEDCDMKLVYLGVDSNQ
jgi:hypothetical protein